MVIVCPGDRLGTEGEAVAGVGTHAKNGVIYASVVGQPCSKEVTFKNEAGGADKVSQVLEVEPVGSRSIVPVPGDIVMAKVTRVQTNSANCIIMCVGTAALTSEFRGVIRQQDVRATEIDKVVMYDCFRPGDLVRAQVLSLGDARFCYLSTAQDEFGVAYASSMSGHPMVPLDWISMQCSKTAAVEKRKVAKGAGKEPELRRDVKKK